MAEQWIDDPTFKPVDLDDGWVDDPSFEQEKAAPAMSAIRKGLQGATAGFSDEAAGLVEGAGRALGFEGAGGPMKDIKKATGGATLDWEILRDAYRKARDHERADLEKDSKDNPEVSAVSEIAGGLVSPLNKVMPTSSLVKSGVALGALTGLGQSESDDLGDMALDAGKGAALGGVLGLGAQKATPYLEKGANAIASQVQKAKTAIGEGASDIAEKLAFKSTGATLKDFRAADGREQVNDIGRMLLDKGIVSAGDSVDDIAAKALTNKNAAGSRLDDIYSKAEEALKTTMSQKGFDPLRDKARIMAAARRELGDTVGADGALSKLSSYLDDVASNHGDAPFEQAMAKYGSDKAQYADDLIQYRKDLSQYKKDLGAAGSDIDQGLLPAFGDDLQRTGERSFGFELQGKPASNMYEEPLELWTQQDLVPLPQRGAAVFNPARGDDLLPMQQQMSLDQRYLENLGDGYQSSILGAHNTPRSYGSGTVPGINQGEGQLQFAIAPNKPIRPEMPEQIRNAMSPRRSNDIKGALDEQINYSRNPLSKEPASEKAFSGARRELNKIVDESINELGGSEASLALKAANKDYGLATQANKIAQDRVNRNSASKMFGLTDTIAAGAGTTYGAVTGDWKTAVGMMALKKGMDKVGTSTLAVAADKIGKQLLKSPQMQKVALENPKAFGAIVYNFVQKMEERGGSSLPKAAEQHESAMIDSDSILNKSNGSPYAQVLQNAANSGDDSLAAAHFVLSSRDPNYRKVIAGQ